MKYEVEYEASMIHQSNTEYGASSSLDLLQKKKECFFYKNKEIKIENENELANVDQPLMFGNELFSHNIKNSVLVSSPVSNNNSPIKEILSKYTWFQGENCLPSNRSSNFLFMKQHSDFMTSLKLSDENYTLEGPFTLSHSNCGTNLSVNFPAVKSSSINILSSLMDKHSDHQVNMDSMNQYHNETKEIHITSRASLISRLCCYVEYKERGKTYDYDNQSSFTIKSPHLGTTCTHNIKKKEALQTIHEKEIFQTQVGEVESNFLNLSFLNSLQPDQRLTNIKEINSETLSDCSSVKAFTSIETNDEHDTTCVKLQEQNPTDFAPEIDLWFQNQYLVPTSPLATNNTVAVSNISDMTVKNASITDLKKTMFNTDAFLRLINLPSYKKIKSNEYRFSKRSSQHFKNRMENLKDVLPVIEEELISESVYLPSISIKTSQKTDNFDFKHQTAGYQIEGEIRSDGNQSNVKNECITLKGEASKPNDGDQTDGDQADAKINYIVLKNIALVPLVLTFVSNDIKQIDIKRRMPLLKPVHQEMNNTTKNNMKINNTRVNNMRINDESRTVSLMQSKISLIKKNQQKNFESDYILNKVHGESKLTPGQSNNIIYDLLRKYSSSTVSLLEKEHVRAVNSNYSLQNSIRSEENIFTYSGSNKMMFMNEENEAESIARRRRKLSTNPFLLNYANQDKMVKRLKDINFRNEPNVFENEPSLFEKETSVFEKEVDLLEIKSQKKTIVKKVTKSTQYTESLSQDSNKAKKRSNLFRVDSYLSKNGNAFFKRKQERRLRHKNSVPDDMYSTNFDIANTVDEKGNSCLHVAAANSDISTIKFILNNGGDASKRNKNNCLPIDLARDFQTAKLLSSAMLFYSKDSETTALTSNLK